VGWKFNEAIGEAISADAGESDEEMAEEFAGKVGESGPDIEFSKGVAADAATVTKAVLIVGNTEGVPATDPGSRPSSRRTGRC